MPPLTSRHFSRYLPALSAIAAGVFLSAGVQAGTLTYSFQTLDNNTDPTFNQLLGINNAGTIAGYYGNGTTNPNKGYTLVPPYGQANYTNENFPGSVQTQVTGINNSGDTVGFWVDGAGANHGFTDIGGTFVSLNDPAGTATPAFDQLLGINDSTVSVGFYTDAAGLSHGYTYDGSFHAVPDPGVSGQPSVTATGINNDGWVSGFTENTGLTAATGFLDIHGVITTYEFDGTATFTQFFGVNSSGLVVGDYQDAAGNTHGLLYDLGTNTWQSIDDPLGPGSTTINGINSKGQLVGFYTDAATGFTHGFLATPTPEVSSFNLAGAAMLLIIVMRKIGYAPRERRG
jgi:hypothetical protein